jgi:D-alanine-D-alanine ligase
MKVAVIYNRESQKVINLFGQPNREKYGLAAINRIVDSLKRGGHQAIALEGDKDLIDKLEEFMPRALAGERPGLAFNLSYGIQGQARYTHVPSILEMVGIPYVGSGPLAHSLALDKVVAKMLFVQNGLPTPEFAVLQDADTPVPELAYPMIVKPKNEAVSFGIRVVQDEAELREAAGVIFREFDQAVLVERYIEGRELNVGLLGNNPPEAFAPAEIEFGDTGPRIYTLEDKKRQSGREIKVICPAQIPETTAKRAQEIAIKAFNVLGCYDCARVDMRLDADGGIYILEVNSLPSLGEHGSYVAAAEHMGLDFAGLINRLVEVASARYFGTPRPPQVSAKRATPDQAVFAFLTERRDHLERRVESWVGVSSRSDDPVGLQNAVKELGETVLEIGLIPARRFEDPPHCYAWETPAGMDDGTLLIGHLDIPVNPSLGSEHFHRGPEQLYGEGIGSSRAPLAMLEFALKSLKQARRLRQLPIGVVYYTDEGRDCIESAATLRKAMDTAKRVLVLRPGNPTDAVVTQRRGQRLYRMVIEGQPLRLGQASRRPEVSRIAMANLEELAKLSSRKDRIAVSTVDIRTEAYPRLLPHRIRATLQASFPDAERADDLEARIRAQLKGSSASLALLSDRPAMASRRTNERLIHRLKECAAKWEIPLTTESSLWPSVAGLVPAHTPVVCGIGPVSQALYTGGESVSRISLVQRTLLLAELLLDAHRS